MLAHTDEHAAIRAPAGRDLRAVPYLRTTILVIPAINRGEPVKTLLLTALLMAATVTVAPAAQAEMQVGNYQFSAPWDSTHSWLWSIACDSVGCPHVVAVPRPNGGASPWTGTAQLADSKYTMKADVPTGRICIGYALPVHDTYTWDAVTLTGSVDSTFDADCGGAPAGSISYPFTLVRM